MKVRYTPGRSPQFEFDGSTQKDIFGQLAGLDEIFSPESCGVCQTDDTRFIVREVDGNSYFERRCVNCNARLAYGQNKSGGSLFPKRKIEKDGQEVYDRDHKGWFRWVPEKKG